MVYAAGFEVHSIDFLVLSSRFDSVFPGLVRASLKVKPSLAQPAGYCPGYKYDICCQVRSTSFDYFDCLLTFGLWLVLVRVSL
jgi:hypothetical protein